MAGWDCKKEVVSLTAMAAVELATVGVNTVYKAATLKGLSYFVFVAYSYAIGTLVLLPLTFIRGRRELPSFPLSLLYRIFLLGLIGFSSNIFAYKGVEYSSPALASAVSNLTPAFTFILAVIFRMEKLDLRSLTTRIKIIGTIFSIAGALVAVLYKGPIIWSSASASASPSPSPKPSFSRQYPLRTLEKNWVKGGLLLASEYLLASTWYILQTNVMKIYPDEKIVVPVYFLCTTAMAVPICFIAETNLRAWTLRPDVTLTATVLSGFFGTSFSSFIHTWGLHLKGPLYISIFRPLSIAIAAAVSVIFLGEALFLGSVLGAAILLVGFYAVIWAKAQEDYTDDFGSEDFGALPNRKIPLLES